jgi:hypothetical protein
MPDRHELIYIKIALDSHFQTFILYFGFNLPFHKTTVLYQNALALTTTRNQSFASAITDKVQKYQGASVITDAMRGTEDEDFVHFEVCQFCVHRDKTQSAAMAASTD